MRILLVNPPNCGRSIPEERYGVETLKQIFRGEPLALETLAGNLRGHEVRILDLKVDPDALAAELSGFAPGMVAFTGMTCEARTVLRLARQVRESCAAKIVVGGVHASNDPHFFNDPGVDFVVIGLGKKSLRELVDALLQGASEGEVARELGISTGTAHQYAVRLYRVFNVHSRAEPRSASCSRSRA